jgi:hypothetical protein
MIALQVVSQAAKQQLERRNVPEGVGSFVPSFFFFFFGWGQSEFIASSLEKISGWAQDTYTGTTMYKGERKEKTFINLEPKKNRRK